jgi:hypothetical protein
VCASDYRSLQMIHCGKRRNVLQTTEIKPRPSSSNLRLPSGDPKVHSPAYLRSRDYLVLRHCRLDRVVVGSGLLDGRFELLGKFFRQEGEHRLPNDTRNQSSVILP